MTYCVDVITADASKLKNRGLAYAFTSSPYIITAFAGPKASDDFHLSWRWGFGMFAIIFPVVAAPLYFILKHNLKRAQQQGLVAVNRDGRTWYQLVWFYFIEFDSTQLSLIPPESRLNLTKLLQLLVFFSSPPVSASSSFPSISPPTPPTAGPRATLSQ